MMLDQFLGLFLDLIESDPVWGSAMICFTSSRGYSLGEHGILGHENELPTNYNEAVHVPLMISLPDTPELRDFRSIRNFGLRQSDLVSDCLLDWFAKDSVGERFRSLAFDIPEPRNQAVIIESNGVDQAVSSIQTQVWKLIKKTDKHESLNGDKFELYAKPDDRWEVNDVSRRCPQVVDALAKILDDNIKAGGLGSQGCLDLEESLWHRAI